MDTINVAPGVVIKEKGVIKRGIRQVCIISCDSSPIGFVLKEFCHVYSLHFAAEIHVKVEREHCLMPTHSLDKRKGANCPFVTVSQIYLFRCSFHFTTIMIVAKDK